MYSPVLTDDDIRLDEPLTASMRMYTQDEVAAALQAYACLRRVHSDQLPVLDEGRISDTFIADTISNKYVFAKTNKYNIAYGIDHVAYWKHRLTTKEGCDAFYGIAEELFAMYNLVIVPRTAILQFFVLGSMLGGMLGALCIWMLSS